MSNTPNDPKSRTSGNDRSRESGSATKSRSSGTSPRRDSAPPADDRPRLTEVLRHARTQLAELTGMAPESVSSFEQSEDGWTLEVEVQELAKVPETMSLMASYRVELDRDGELTGYRRVRRYERGRADPHPRGGH